QIVCRIVVRIQTKLRESLRRNLIQVRARTGPPDAPVADVRNFKEEVGSDFALDAEAELVLSWRGWCVPIEKREPGKTGNLTGQWSLAGIQIRPNGLRYRSGSADVCESIDSDRRVRLVVGTAHVNIGGETVSKSPSTAQDRFRTQLIGYAEPGAEGI